MTTKHNDMNITIRDKQLDVAFDDRFINESKLPSRLTQIFRSDSWRLTWRTGQYVIENAPFDLEKSHLASLRAL